MVIPITAVGKFTCHVPAAIIKTETGIQPGFTDDDYCRKNRIASPNYDISDVCRVEPPGGYLSQTGGCLSQTGECLLNFCSHKSKDGFECESAILTVNQKRLAKVKRLNGEVKGHSSSLGREVRHLFIDENTPGMKRQLRGAAPLTRHRRRRQQGGRLLRQCVSS